MLVFKKSSGGRTIKFIHKFYKTRLLRLSKPKKEETQKSYKVVKNLFDRNIKWMSIFGDERRLPLYALMLAILTAIFIDLLAVVISYL